jgi:hypothetical protein
MKTIHYSKIIQACKLPFNAARGKKAYSFNNLKVEFPLTLAK